MDTDGKREGDPVHEASPGGQDRKKPKKEFDPAGQATQLLPEITEKLKTAKGKADVVSRDAETMLDVWRKSENKELFADAALLLQHRLSALQVPRLFMTYVYKLLIVLPNKYVIDVRVYV